MQLGKLVAIVALLIFALSVRFTSAAKPRAAAGYKLELISAHPEIVTPIGMAFDKKGRLLIIESHTHQRPEGYKGPDGDRIRMLSDSDGDGKLDKWSTFADGFRHAMNLLARNDGGLCVVTRGYLYLLHDTDDDGVADKKQELLRLETEDDYPHNALGGIDQTADGSLIIGLGENHGIPFRLIGSDGKVFAATGGVDGVFRCTPDGRNIEHLARGVWNPFSLCVVPDGRIFAVDNDPDSSPPCRLLHIVPGGDYGYLYQYGRAGTHPLQCWNGELPGTLPMVCGVGEAPTAIVPHAGSLWVTSWGDHRIERYRLVPRGSSWGAEREVIVQGDADFRPTGMAVASDGSLYFGDWVLRDYPVHARGRIWRLSLPQADRDVPIPLQTTTSLATNDPFSQAVKNWKLSRGFKPDWLVEQWTSDKLLYGTRLDYLVALRLCRLNNPDSVLQSALHDKSPDVRLYAVRWIADERITALRDDVAKLLDEPQPGTRYYLAVLAAVDWLDHEPTMRGTQIADELLLKELRIKTRSADAHALALKLLSPNNEFLSLDRLRGYLMSDHLPLRLEAVRTLAQQTNSKRFALLAEVAGDESQDTEMRAEAMVGLAASAETQRELLEKLAGSGEKSVQTEAQRVLRLVGIRATPAEAKLPADNLAGWNSILGKPGDAASGRRLFFSQIGPRCAVCHQHDGRGGRIGPDLTNVGRSNNREQIIASILQPSREVAPHYQPWSLVTSDGKTHVGLRKAQGGDNGVETYIDSAGNEFSLPSDTIEERSASEKSIMPDGLQEILTIDDLRELVTFLLSSPSPQ